MGRVTLHQKLFGLSKKDLVKLKQTEESAIAIAMEAADKRYISWLPDNPGAWPTVFKGRVAWHIENEEPVDLIGMPTKIYLDDEAGEILKVYHHIR